jgi:hypothetical protein
VKAATLSDFLGQVSSALVDKALMYHCQAAGIFLAQTARMKNKAAVTDTDDREI